MKANNNKFYKIFSFCFLVGGIFAIVNVNNWETRANAPVPNSETVTTSSQYSRNRHIINVVLNELDELKVEEGQRINPGDIISDHAVPRFARSHFYKN